MVIETVSNFLTHPASIALAIIVIYMLWAFELTRVELPYTTRFTLNLLLITSVFVLLYSLIHYSIGAPNA